MNDTIYTRDEAGRIVDLFDDLLTERGIAIPDPGDDDAECCSDDDPIVVSGLYGMPYYTLLDAVEARICDITLRLMNGASVQISRFSSKY